MKLLFISSRDVNKTSHGGYQCTNRNYLSFCELLGINNVEVLNLVFEGEKSFFWSIERRINRILGFYDGLSKKMIKRILYKSEDYDYIFIDSSIYGRLASSLKQKKFRKVKLFAFLT